MIQRKDGFRGERAVVLPQFIVQELEEHPVSAQLHITDIGYYPKARYHFINREEPISQYVFIYCYEGSGWYQLGGKKFQVKTNEYFILPAGLPHSYGSSDADPWTIYWIHFKGKLAPYFCPSVFQPIAIKPGVYSRISNRMDMFEEILHTLSMGYSKENLLYACSIFYHYLGTLRYLHQYREAANNSPCKIDPITEAIHYMKENIEKRLTLNELSKHVGYSSSHFTAIFRQRTGYAPYMYFNLLKIQHACFLLDFSDIKINQVCYKIGIEDPYYFSRLFTKLMGVSPTDYKKQKKG